MRRTGTETTSLQPTDDRRWQCGVPSEGSTGDRQPDYFSCSWLKELTVGVERDGHKLDGGRNGVELSTELQAKMKHSSCSLVCRGEVWRKPRANLPKGCPEDLAALPAS